jgi:predicted ATPase
MASKPATVISSDLGTCASEVTDRWAGIHEHFPVAFHAQNDVDAPASGSEPPIYRVVISGGPCGGKTTTLAEVSDRMRSRGFAVFIVPEAATLLIQGGAPIGEKPLEQLLAFQASLLRTQIALEDNFYRIAKASSKPAILLCDRGVMDGRAYMSPAEWAQMLEINHWDVVKLRDERYDLIIHMVTAADGAEKFYQLSNNMARSEAPETARVVDKRTQNAWVGHPHLHIIDNRTGFREKIERVFFVIAKLVGVKSITKRDVRKYLVDKNAQPRALDSAVDNLEEFEVEQTFLKRGRIEGAQESVRRRGEGKSYTFVHKVRWAVPGTEGKSEETKRQISNREYISLLANADPERRTVRIKRQCFLVDSRYYVLDTILNVEPTVRLIRTRVDLDETVLELPRWLHTEREVTDEPEWTMYALSTRIKPERMKWPMTELSPSDSDAMRSSVDQAMSY